MDQDSHCTAERELLETVSRITTASTTSPTDEEQNQPKAEISCEVRKENPEKDDLQDLIYTPGTKTVIIRWPVSGVHFLYITKSELGSISKDTKNWIEANLKQ